MKRFKSERGLKRQQSREYKKILQHKDVMLDAFVNLILFSPFDYQTCYNYLVHHWKQKASQFNTNKKTLHMAEGSFEEYKPIHVSETPKIVSISFWNRICSHGR